MANGFFKIFKGLNAQPITGSTVTTKGDVAYNDSSAQVEVFTTAAESVTTNSNTQTLTNKSISGSTNTLTNIPNGATNATSANTPSTIVARDSSGNFAAGTITATLTGNASNVSGVVAIANGGTNSATLITAPTANSISSWDSNSNLSSNNFIEGYATTATAGGTTTLTVSSGEQQYFTGSLIQTVLLPVTSTLVVGQKYFIYNSSIGNVTVQSSGGNQIGILSSNMGSFFTVISTSGTTASSWSQASLGGASASLVAPTTQTFSSGSGLYTTPITPRSPLYIKIKLVGGGGGGSGSGTSGAGTGGNGGDSLFGTSLLVAGGGVGGMFGQVGPGGMGGTASLGTGPLGVAIIGSMGNSFPSVQTGASFGESSGAGGNSPYFAGGGPSSYQADGVAGNTNTGGGGSGGGAQVTGDTIPGAGGGSGGFIEATITSPSSTYGYTVGSAGTAGTLGASGNVGGAGGSGMIIVEEFYQ